MGNVLTCLCGWIGEAKNLIVDDTDLPLEESDVAGPGVCPSCFASSGLKVVEGLGTARREA